MSSSTFIHDLIEQLDLTQLKGFEIQAIIDACFTELQRRKGLRTVNSRGEIRKAPRSPRKP